MVFFEEFAGGMKQLDLIKGIYSNSQCEQIVNENN